MSKGTHREGGNCLPKRIAWLPVQVGPQVFEKVRYKVLMDALAMAQETKHVLRLGSDAAFDFQSCPAQNDLMAMLLQSIAEKIQQHVVIDGKLLIESRVIAEKMSFNPIR